MIECQKFYKLLTKHKIQFFSGVPDSLLKDFCAFIKDNVSDFRHVIAANEGNAVALATGYYLATGKSGLVYMQNSGQGNAANPLASLVDRHVYGIPVLLLIGWRGEPNARDEPQHITQGRITLPLLETLEIPYRILPDSVEGAGSCLEDLCSIMDRDKGPVAIVVRKGTFKTYKLMQQTGDLSLLSRETAVQMFVDSLHPKDIVVSTTGMISRELYEYRDRIDGNHSKDFLTVGSMGHASQVAMGVALEKSDRPVFCLDGDGAALMHMGGLAVIGSRKLLNLRHIILNNAAHDSVGGQPTVAGDIDWPKIALACGYKSAWTADTEQETARALLQLRREQGPSLLEIRVKKGSRPNLGRPRSTPIENKLSFMEFLT